MNTVQHRQKYAVAKNAFSAVSAAALLREHAVYFRTSRFQCRWKLENYAGVRTDSSGFFSQNALYLFNWQQKCKQMIPPIFFFLIFTFTNEEMLQVEKKRVLSWHSNGGKCRSVTQWWLGTKTINSITLLESNETVLLYNHSLSPSAVFIYDELRNMAINVSFCFPRFCR